MSVIQLVVDQVKYPPEKIAETRQVAALAATTWEMYSNVDECEPRLIWLRECSLARNANVSLAVTGTVADKRYEDLIPFGAALPEIDDTIKLNVPFDFNAQVQIYNAAVAAIANYRARVIWEVQEYRVADKLSMGIKYTSLDDEEKRLADKYKLIRSIRGGKLPMPYPKGDLQYQFNGNFAGVLAAAQEVNLFRRTVPDGYKLVVTKLWADRPAANFGALELRVYRDRTLYQTLFPHCFPDYTTAGAPPSTRAPVEVWIPALGELRVTIASTTGHAAQIAMAQCELRRLTIWDKMAWGLENKRKITSGEERDMISELELRDKLDAGIYELLTPIPELEMIG